MRASLRNFLCVLSLLVACRKDKVTTNEAAADASPPSPTPPPYPPCKSGCAEAETCIGTSCQPRGDLAMGPKHTCVLLATGHVQCWGANESGEVGDGALQMRDRPIAVAGVEDAIEIAAREQLTCVRRRSGVVSCWGELGGGGGGGGGVTGRALKPTDVAALRDSIGIALAEDVFCGLKKSGEIVCLPRRKDDKNLPVPDVKDAVSIAATTRNLCAARRDGSVVCWDFDEQEASKRRHIIKDVVDAVGVRASGNTTMCAFRAEGGKVQCWGGGIVTTRGGIRDTMVGGTHDFSPLGSVTDLAFRGWPHDYEDCATKSDSGDTVCWSPPYIEMPAPAPDGGSASGSIALPTLPIKTKTMKLPPAYRVRTQGFDSAHCALTKASEVYCWGGLSYGRLGVGRPSEQPSPRLVDGVKGVTAEGVVASDYRACVRTASGLQCWGGGTAPHAVTKEGLDRVLSGRCASIKGELTCFDDGDPFDKAIPASDLKGVVQIVQGGSGSHLLSYFTRNSKGEVGRVDWEKSNTGGDPVWTRKFSGVAKNLSNVTELFSADRTTCARERGVATSLRCWSSLGDPKLDPEGKLEIDTMTVKLPAAGAPFDQLQMLRVFDSGSSEGCGVKDGRVGCWNSIREGMQWVEEIKDPVRRFAMSPQGSVSCALTSSSTLYCWGHHEMTGNGSITGSDKPEALTMLKGVAGFSFAQPSSSARNAVYVWLTNGDLYAWGHNSQGSREKNTIGQLGFTDEPELKIPTKIELAVHR